VLALRVAGAVAVGFFALVARVGLGVGGAGCLRLRAVLGIFARLLATARRGARPFR